MSEPRKAALQGGRYAPSCDVQLTDPFQGRDRYLRKISNGSDREAVYRKPNPNELTMKSAEDRVWTNDSSRLNRARDWRNLGERPTRIFSGHLGRAIFNLIRGLANSCYAVQCALKSELPMAYSLQSSGELFRLPWRVHAFPILVLNLSPTQFTLSVDKMTGGALLNWGMTMRTAYPQDNKPERLNESPLRGEEYTEDVLSLLEEDAQLRGNETAFQGDEHTDDVLSLLEENARLRGLVVRLSSLILKHVADQR